MNANQLFHAAIHALVPGAPIESVVEDDSAVGQMTPGAVRIPVEGVLPSFDGATAWLNSPPLTPAGLRGKVVLASFWPTPASTGCASFSTSAPGPGNTPATGWW